MLNAALIMLAAVLLDRMLGEPRRFHPLVAFGRYANLLERRCNRGKGLHLRGVLAWLLAVAPFALLTDWLAQQAGFIVECIVLYFCIAMQSLREHAGRIQAALQSDNLPEARLRVGEIVSRDTAALSEQEIAKAGVESVLENGNDAVFGALFWFAILGAPGALAYRLANTLDAMWGYRTARYVDFGWAAARIDDVLNFIPARLTALTYAVLGKTRSAFFCWRTQAQFMDSPNAGPVMASGAGSLQILLGGAAVYHGQIEARPALGCGAIAQSSDIARAVALVQRGVWLWLTALLVIGVTCA